MNIIKQIGHGGIAAIFYHVLSYILYIPISIYFLEMSARTGRWIDGALGVVVGALYFLRQSRYMYLAPIAMGIIVTVIELYARIPERLISMMAFWQILLVLGLPAAVGGFAGLMLSRKVDAI